MTTFRIITLGCKVNQYESAWLRESLRACGWKWESGGPVDVTVVNTCIVTRSASRQSRQEIRKAARRSPGALVAATGCYAQVFPGELSHMDGVGLVVGNSRKGDLPELLETAGAEKTPGVVSNNFGPSAPFDPMPLNRFPGRSRAFLKVQDGCESFCTYCVVPFARGPSRSLAAGEVLRALDVFCSGGHEEIVLTGIHLGLYQTGLTPGGGLAALLRLIRREKYPARIRLSSLEPTEVTEEIIELVSEGGWICRHLHIPLQSGDDKVLAAMNRHYTAGAFAALIRRVHESCPQGGIGVDVMCGFPGETHVAFENTRNLLSDLPVSYLHVFPYSPRPGTKAESLPGRVSDREIKARTEAVRAVGLEKQVEFFRASLGLEFEVLREMWESRGKGIALGTGDNYLPVRFRCGPADDLASLFKVRAEIVSGKLVEGTIVKTG